jgi:hypothetical protein
MKLAPLLLAAGLAMPASAAVTPVTCSQLADVLYALLHGQPVRFPDEFRPYLVKAAEHWQSHQTRPAYYHSTVLFMECLRTGGSVSEMYDERRIVDPEQPFSRL